MAALVDTNILVYGCDPRFPEKRRVARDLLREGILHENLRIPHQALVEFYSAVTRPGPMGDSILPQEEAIRQTEELMSSFPIVYPTDHVVRTALRGVAAYRLPWFDAHLWAYADHYGLDEILSEDFQHGRLYGSVRIRNPFVK